MMLYVAISRATRFENVYLYNFQDLKIKDPTNIDVARLQVTHFIPEFVQPKYGFTAIINGVQCNNLHQIVAAFNIFEAFIINSSKIVAAEIVSRSLLKQKWSI